MNNLKPKTSMKYTKIWTKNYGNLMLKRAQESFPKWNQVEVLVRFLKMSY